MELGWGRVRTTWTTHALNGLSKNDFICAAKVQSLAGR
jgi:4a-hydroxytetrahydrobiopterin dehydratase